MSHDLIASLEKQLAEVTRERDEARCAAKIGGDTLANAKMRADWTEALLEKKLRAGPEEERFAIDGILCKTNEHQAVISAERFRADKAERERDEARASGYAAGIKAAITAGDEAWHEEVMRKGSTPLPASAIMDAMRSLSPSGPEGAVAPAAPKEHK